MMLPGETAWMLDNELIMSDLWWTTRATNSPCGRLSILNQLDIGVVSLAFDSGMRDCGPVDGPRSI